MILIPPPLQEPLALEVAAVLDQLHSPQERRAFGELQTALDQGEVPPELEEVLARLLRMSLETGRFARLYGPHAEAAARRLFLATEPGRQLAQQAQQINQALALWNGRRLDRVQLSVRGPGAYALELEGEGARTVILLDHQGVRLQGIEAT